MPDQSVPRKEKSFVVGFFFLLFLGALLVGELGTLLYRRIAALAQEGGEALLVGELGTLLYLHQPKASLMDMDKCPACGLIATQRFALGAIFVYQLAVWYRFEYNLPLCVCLKAFLKAA